MTDGPDLAARVAELERQLAELRAELAAEVRTRRVVVHDSVLIGDDDGREAFIRLEVDDVGTDSVAMVTVFGPGAEPSAGLFVGEDVAEVGLQVAGHDLGSLAAFRDRASGVWWRRKNGATDGATDGATGRNDTLRHPGPPLCPPIQLVGARHENGVNLSQNLRARLDAVLRAAGPDGLLVVDLVEQLGVSKRQVQRVLNELRAGRDGHRRVHPDYRRP